MKFKGLFLAIIFLMVQILSGCSVNSGGTYKNSSKKNEEEIIYISSNGRNIEIFNIDELYFSQEGVGYLKRRDYEYGEFGGDMEFCSNDEYYCMGGGLNIAIPKNIRGQRKWLFEERECQASAALSAQPTEIVCDFKGYSRRFVFSPTQGVVSYFLDRPSGQSYEFRLMGDKGLFSPKGSRDQ